MSQVISLKELLWRLFSLLLYYYKEYYSNLLLFMFRASHRCPKESIVTIAGRNILDET
jgi:hypothetical protein